MNIIPMPPTKEQAYCWLFARNQQKIGVHQSKGWCTQLRDESPVFFDTEDKCVLILILLELEPAAFERYLVDASSAVPEYANSIKRFPLMKLLKHAFNQSVSDYWPEKALLWMNAKPDLQRPLASELEHMMHNKAMSQSLRHRIRRMLRELQRATAPV